MTIAKFGHVSEGQYAEAMGDRAAEAVPVREIPMPRRATAGSAGYDFISPVETVVPAGGSALIPTGIRAEMEPGLSTATTPSRKTRGTLWSSCGTRPARRW